jgi:hypothetical protein
VFEFEIDPNGSLVARAPETYELSAMESLRRDGWRPLCMSFMPPAGIVRRVMVLMEKGDT